MPRNIPGSVAARRSPSRTDPSRPLPSTTVVTRDVGPERGGRHRRTGRARTLQVLTSALAGGGLVAAHAATGGGLPRVDDLALQAFSSPAADASLTDAVPSAHSGTARSLAEPPPPVDIDAIVGAANGAVGSAVTARDEARERARAAAREAREAAARATDSARSSSGAADAPSTGGPTGSTTCALGTAGMEGVATNVARAGEKLRCLFGVDSVLGIGSRGNASDHPSGKALDFMVDRATGDRLAAYAQQNREELGISYIIWRQRIDTGSGWTAQEDRGGATANHMDHVHISFS
ncbi:hypothetical protein [Pseudonocardia sp. HH130629-09]|uniref:hypothetical protein n=1 Tax=Pseudonocardia sp. HH130629-09 TaxID=1641402 RepID=UPI000A9FDA71|nr:hypothetical protein [Pseudonocardia sp. HH130629-09]